MLHNIDTNEIEKFSHLAKEWWDPNGKCKPLHIINPLRVEYIRQNGPENFSNSTILDIGCGGGILSESLAKLGANVTGLDLADASLDVARSHAEQNGLTINYIKSSIEEYAEKTTNQYDLITCMELLEHVPDPQSIITASAKLLKPGGKMFLSTINRNHKAKLLLIYGAEYITQLVPKGTHDFARFIRPSELMQMVENAGLRTDNVIGMEYRLLSNKFILGKNIDVNYILVALKEPS